MDFQSAMETFAEAWVAANTKGGPLGDVGCSQNQAMALTRGCKTPPSPPPQQQPPPPPPALRLSSEPPPGARSPPPLASSTPKQDSLLLANPKDEYDVAKGASGLASGRSLPVHCVVEAVAALGGDGKLGWKRRPVVETDSYVIIPANTAFHDLVAVALARLGYPTESASAAKGTVVIKNWKPLNFDKITDGAQATVEDILGELTTVATLRIELYRARPSVLSDIKDKLLRLLLLQSHGLLLTAGCPLDEVTLSQLCRGAVGAPGLQPPPLEPSEDMRRKFEQWWTLQMAQQAAAAGGPGRVPPGQPQFSPGGPHAGAPPGASGAKSLERPPSLPDAVHPALQTVQSQYPTQKTRMRTSFDPELELPKLQRWFAENQHPSRQQIQQYVKELNGLESRRGRKPLDVNNVVYWFKNARAAQKRAELRSVGPGLSCSLSLNGYNSSSHSPPGALLGSEGLVHHDKSPGSPSLHSPSGGRIAGTGGGSVSGVGGGSGGGGSGAGTPAGAGSGGGYMGDAHSENSGGASDQEDDDDQEGRGGGGESQHGPQPPPPPPPPPPLAPGSRPEHPEGRGDPRAELPGHEDMDDGPGSPAAPLSLTTNDKDPLSGAPLASPHLQGSPQLQCDFSPHRSPLEGRRSAFSPTASAFDGRRSAFTRSPWAVPLQADIKQEPPEEAPSPAPSNNNNNGSVKEMEEGSEAEEDEEEEEIEDGDERRLGLKEEPADPGTVALRAPDRALRPFRTPSPPDVLGRGPPGPGLASAGFPLVPNSMFSHSIMYMSHYIPGLAGHGLPPGATPPSSSGGGPAGLNLSALAASAADERRKRNRTFIDPVTEVPRLEQWFALNTHPSHNLILKYTEELNRMPYRQKFPRLEPKNVQFWFKNRRAKCKRLKMSLFENGPGAAAAAAAVAAGVNHQHHHPNPYHHSPPGGRD